MAKFRRAALKAPPDSVGLSEKYRASNMRTQNIRNWCVEVYKSVSCINQSIFASIISEKNFGQNIALFYIIVIYYHFNIPTEGPFRCVDTQIVLLPCS